MPAVPTIDDDDDRVDFDNEEEEEAVLQKRGERGRDKAARKVSQRSYTHCTKWCPANKFKCTGRGGPDKCDLFDSFGNRRCGRCARVNAKDAGEPKTKGLNAYTCTAAKSDIDCFDPDSCEYYNNRLKDRLQNNA